MSRIKFTRKLFLLPSIAINEAWAGPLLFCGNEVDVKGFHSDLRASKVGWGREEQPWMLKEQ